MGIDPQPTPSDAKQEDLYCVDCGYNLRGLSGDVRACPECGTVNHLDDAFFDEAMVRLIHQRLERRWCLATCTSVLEGVALLMLVLEPDVACCGFAVIGGIPWLVFFLLTIGAQSGAPSALERPFVNHQIVTFVLVLLGAILAKLLFAVEKWCGLEGALRNRSASMLGGFIILLLAGVLAVLLLYRRFDACCTDVRAALRPEAEAIARYKNQTRLRTPPESRGWPLFRR